jgi:MFS superfamily sulfate permease-like transporter
MKRVFANDFLASIVVFLVALPLCMGIAIASGMPPAAGLITGIVGGLVVGFIGGAPLQVSGPAAGMAVIVWELVEKHGPVMLGIIVLFAGLLQLAAGLASLGQWFRAISPAVIHGMLAGIGAVIFASQFHIMVDDKPRGSGILNLISIPEAIYKGIFALDGSTHHLAATIGIITIIVMVLWTRYKPAKLKFIPGPLVAVVVGSSAANVLGYPIKFVSVPDNLFATFVYPSWEALQKGLTPEILGAALAVAFIASAETLLCTAATDQIAGTRSNYDKELAAQGVGNALCGLVGALPMTGVIVRSTANIEAGGKTKYSAILHSVWLLLLVVAFSQALALIPLASLAAILVFTGYKLVNPAKIRLLARFGRGEVAIYAATFAGIVVTDLLKGVILGIILAVGKLLYTFTHLKIHRVERSGDRVDIHLEGAATFVGLPKLAAALEQIPPGVELHLHFENLNYIDHACLDLIHNWKAGHTVDGTRVVVEWDALELRYHKAGPGSEVEQENRGSAQLTASPRAQ